ncbi:MAG: hypothetical protein GY862_09350 [Gammaproteobacteria bacterium]|nr:hypothetical protein [Gammaproteobacteria bacterium]
MKMSFQQKQELVDLLLECPRIRDPQSRQTVVAELPFDTAVQMNNDAKVYVLNLVNACLNHPGGLDSLADAIRFFDKDTIQFKALNEFLGKLRKKSPGKKAEKETVIHLTIQTPDGVNFAAEAPSRTPVSLLMQDFLDYWQKPASPQSVPVRYTLHCESSGKAPLAPGSTLGEAGLHGEARLELHAQSLDTLFSRIQPAYKPSRQSRPMSRCPRSRQSNTNTKTYSAKEHHDLYIYSSAFEKIQKHIAWGKHTPENLFEQGGILLGHAFVDEHDVIYGVVEDVVTARGTATYLEISHETRKDMFDRVDALTQQQASRSHVLGWYHTHPGMLDVFMSGTDRNTQEHLFGNEWHFALVLNPQQQIWRVFQGAGVKECMGCVINTRTSNVISDTIES